MKRCLIILTILGVISAVQAEKFPVGLGVAAGYSLEENNNMFFIEGTGLIHIYRDFYARTGLFNISFPSAGNQIAVGTGTINTGTTIGFRPGIDLLMFFKGQSIAPYGLAGFLYSNGGGHSQFDFRIGGGVEFVQIKAPVYPYAEASLDINTTSVGNTSSSHTVVSLKLGIRVK